jgi:hypothetical protein
MVADPDVLDGRVDLDRVDMISPVLQRHRDVCPRARADDEDAIEDAIGKPAVRLFVERLDDPIRRPHALMGNAIDVDGLYAA